MATHALEIRLAHLEGAYEQIDRRMGSIENRMASIEGRMASLEYKQDRHFLWLLGLLIVSILLPLASRAAGH